MSSNQQNLPDHNPTGQNPSETKSMKKPSFWRMMISVLQASFGVQNSANRERDFEHGSITGFIAAALVFTLIFIMLLVLLVRWVLSGV
jgi:hypothetical protein